MSAVRLVPGPPWAPRSPWAPDHRALTSAVLGHPAHGRKDPVDVEVLPVKLSTLLLSEVALLLGTRLRVAGPKFHPTPGTVLSTVFWPEQKGRTHAVYKVFLSPVASGLLGKAI